MSVFPPAETRIKPGDIKRSNDCGFCQSEVLIENIAIERNDVTTELAPTRRNVHNSTNVFNVAPFVQTTVSTSRFQEMKIEDMRKFLEHFKVPFVSDPAFKTPCEHQLLALAESLGSCVIERRHYPGRVRV